MYTDILTHSYIHSAYHYSACVILYNDTLTHSYIHIEYHYSKCIILYTGKRTFLCGDNFCIFGWSCISN